MAKILVVDDEPDMRFAVNLVLSQAGHVVYEGASGEEAVAQVRARQDLDLLLLDMRMPGMTGLEAIEKIRTFNQDLPVIMVTAFKEKGLADRAVAAGAAMVLFKPFQNEEVLAAIKKHGAARKAAATAPGGPNLTAVLGRWMVLLLALLGVVYLLQNLLK